MNDPHDFTRLRRERILESALGDEDERPEAPQPSTAPDAPRPRNDDLSGRRDLDDDADASDEENPNDSRRAPRGQRVMLREIEEDEAGRAENLMADTPPDADHAPEAGEKARTWAKETPVEMAGPLVRSATTIEGQVAADAAEITPLEAERMGLNRGQRLSHEPVHRPAAPAQEVPR